MAKKQLITLYVGENHEIKYHGYAEKSKIKQLEKIGRKWSSKEGVARLVWHENDSEGIPRPSYEYIWENGGEPGGYRPPCGW